MCLKRAQRILKDIHQPVHPAAIIANNTKVTAAVPPDVRAVCVLGLLDFMNNRFIF